MKNWPLTPDYPQSWALGFALAIWITGRVLPLGTAWLASVGWLIALAALVIMIWAMVHFHRSKTSPNPFGQPSALITDGPFRWSRNPIYLADAALLTGLCLAFRALPALVLIPVFVAIINRRFIAPEEARLATAFPAGFAAYANRVRRWL
ncbi:isoprenylcysteine carboxylmethyltransferase family protein [Paracoccus sp. M683]|uniref:methyltransferase family protein n=1 Tax=Paracoccus sp. M683 TaxID=2594268 RepID=UPI00163DD425|nr:isoprenylcysteine carboxylmethyltransferase family protein [Paracoccus sp. M683]